MVGALKTLGIELEERWEECEMVVHGCGGRFPAQGGELFLGNAGTAMRCTCLASPSFLSLVDTVLWVPLTTRMLREYAAHSSPLTTTLSLPGPRVDLPRSPQEAGAFLHISTQCTAAHLDRPCLSAARRCASQVS